MIFVLILIVRIRINIIRIFLSDESDDSDGGDSDEDDSEEDIVNYPCCVAVPAIYCNDASIEALLEATGGTGVVFQRSVCALAGALLPTVDEKKPNMLLQHLNKLTQDMQKAFQKEQVQNPDAHSRLKCVCVRRTSRKML